MQRSIDEPPLRVAHVNARGLTDPDKLKIICQLLIILNLDAFMVTETWHHPPPLGSRNFMFLQT